MAKIKDHFILEETWEFHRADKRIFRVECFKTDPFPREGLHVVQYFSRSSELQNPKLSEDKLAVWQILETRIRFFSHVADAKKHARDEVEKYEIM